MPTSKLNTFLVIVNLRYHDDSNVTIAIPIQGTFPLLFQVSSHMRRVKRQYKEDMSFFITYLTYAFYSIWDRRIGNANVSIGQ